MGNTPVIKRLVKIILGIFLLLFLGGLIWFFQTNAPLHHITMDDGSVFSIVDTATKPNEEFYVGVPWKRGFALILKNSDSSLKKNFGHLSVTNQSAISWQRKYFTNASTPTSIFAFYRDPVDIVRLVDAQGVEHAPKPFFSLTDKQPNGDLIDCGVFLFDAGLQPPAFLRIYGRDSTNVVTFNK